ncbi:hypothetical protein KJ644_00180 [Candidatus Dependentiae bacterium]|nr:hypothetical protein [Candidatus Dependentiae bacterium]MBU4386876.1 hypothetical protein [Candidatus Dependentiae bacterium]MCG2756485.1 hypothetical protein [Candidatus Dependentiae bacterium]
MNKLKMFLVVFLLSFSAIVLNAQDEQVIDSNEADIMAELKKTVINDQDKILFEQIEKQEIDLIVILEALQEKDKYSAEFLNNLSKSLTENLPAEFWMEFLNLAIANNLSINAIKSVINLSKTLSPDIVGMLSFKKYAPVYQMKLFAYFIAILAQNTTVPYSEWESKILNLWNDKKAYINEIFDYIFSTEFYKKNLEILS